MSNIGNKETLSKNLKYNIDGVLVDNCKWKTLFI